MDPLLGPILLQLILIAVNAFFSAGEVALMALNTAKLKSQADSGDRRSEALLALTEDPTAFQFTVQIIVALSTLLGSAFCAVQLAQPLARWLIQSVGVTAVSAPTVQVLAVILLTLLLCYCTLVLGVLVPRRVAMQRSARVARLTAPLIAGLSRLLRPTIWFLTVSAAGVLRLLGIQGDLAPDNATEEEIRMMLDESEEEGLIESTEGEMIDNIFEFNNIQIYDVMTHRVDVDSIDLHASRAEITEYIRSTGYSRFPVYEDTPDNIIGVLYMKDFFLNQDTPLPELLKEPIFVPDSMICDDLFRKMQREHTHFAVVTDEYGAFQGIVTLEDLIEEIVGNIYDEYDEKEDYIIPNPDGSWTISGRAELKDVEKALGLSLAEREDFNTLSGLILSETEEIPRDGEQFEVEVDGLRIQVLRVAERRIEETRVTLPPTPDAEQDPNG